MVCTMQYPPVVVIIATQSSVGYVFAGDSPNGADTDHPGAGGCPPPRRSAGRPGPAVAGGGGGEGEERPPAHRGPALWWWRTSAPISVSRDLNARQGTRTEKSTEK